MSPNEAVLANSAVNGNPCVTPVQAELDQERIKSRFNCKPMVALNPGGNSIC